MLLLLLKMMVVRRGTGRAAPPLAPGGQARHHTADRLQPRYGRRARFPHTLQGPIDQRTGCWCCRCCCCCCCSCCCCCCCCWRGALGGRGVQACRARGARVHVLQAHARGAGREGVRGVEGGHPPLGDGLMRPSGSASRAADALWAEAEGRRRRGLHRSREGTAPPAPCHHPSV